MSKKDCANSDWEKVGYENGASGLSSEEGLKLKRKCEKKNISVSILDYKRGWLKGIEQHCSPKNAYQKGISGEEIKAENCPVELRSMFSQNYERGLVFTQTKQKIEKIEEKILSKQNEREQLDSEINDLKREISNHSFEKNKLVTKKRRVNKNAKSASSKSVKYDIH